MIKPLLGKTEHHLLNSKELVTKVEDKVLEEDEIWISHDVVALFPSVPVEEALNIIETRLREDKTLAKRTLLEPDDIMELLRLVVNTTIFSFKGKLYQQSSGFPMGSPISPGACDSYCEKFEVGALQSAPDAIRPRLWLRYVDDVLEIIKKHSVDLFTKHLNNITPSMQFTVECESEENGTQHLPVLDVDIIRNSDGSSKFKIYK